MNATSLFEKKPTEKCSWENLPSVALNVHDPKYLKVLQSHNMENIQLPIPLVERYSKGRRWTKDEFEFCYNAWLSGASLTLIAASLNRNPQDMIYKLIDRCKRDSIPFSQKGKSEGSSQWTPAVAACATDLFEVGLPAWKIAVLFRVDFEHTEKALFTNRKDYGHNKKNPFAICTDHKHKSNEIILENHPIYAAKVLDAFTGEGTFTKQVRQSYSQCEILSVEENKDIFGNLPHLSGVRWINDNNINVIKQCIENKDKFDIIDLDPFVTCYQQVELIWEILNNTSLLFVTFGGEYRRSFIQTNRKAIAKRYGFFDSEIDNKSYLQQVPNYFIGWIANKAAENNFTFCILRSVRYPNLCRFWLKINKAQDNIQAKRWLSQEIIKQHNGYFWKNLEMPSFREIRHEIDKSRVLIQRNLF